MWRFERAGGFGAELRFEEVFFGPPGLGESFSFGRFGVACGHGAAGLAGLFAPGLSQAGGWGGWGGMDGMGGIRGRWGWGVGWGDGWDGDGWDGGDVGDGWGWGGGCWCEVGLSPVLLGSSHTDGFVPAKGGGIV